MKVIALVNARLTSSRLPNKLLKPFADTSLAEISIKRLKNLKNFNKKYFAAYDEPLLHLAKKYLDDDSILTRSKESTQSNNNVLLEFGHVKDIDFDYCVWINSCHAHLKAETIENAVYLLRNKSYPSMTSAIKHYSWFYENNGSNPINMKYPNEQKNTQQSKPIFEVAHAFHIWRKEHFFNTLTVWNNKHNDPYLFEIDKIEALDVDDEKDFIISESVYKNIQE